MILSRAERLGAAVTRRFDRISPKFDGVTVVGGLAGLTAFVASRQMHSLESGCAPLPIDLIRLEVTFSTSRFAAMLHAADKCAANVVSSFVTWDAVFPFCYGALLCALYLWTTRWRRFEVNDAPIPSSASPRRNLIAVAPLVALLLDLIFENLPLWLAGRAFFPGGGGPTTLVKAFVLLGSTAALLKWILLLISVAAILTDVVSGPRGAVLWRVRFSTLAVLVGGVPLLAIPQGQDILQQLFEGDHPAWRLTAAVPPLMLVTLAIWYCGRKILEVELPNTPVPAGPGWHAFFAEQVPRILGIVFLGLVGTAFAKAAFVAPRYLGVVVGVFLVALLLRRFFPQALGRIARPLLPRTWRAVPGLDERIGRLLVAALLGLLTIWPSASNVSLLNRAGDSDEWTVFFLRVAAYLCFVAAWIFQLYVRFRRYPGKPPFNSTAITRPLIRGVVISAMVSLAFLVAFTVAPVPFARWIGPLWVLAIAASNAVFIGTLTVWVGKRYRVPVVRAAVTLGLLFSLWNDGHTIRALPGSSLPARPSLSTELQAWLRDLPQPSAGNATPIVLVAASGGGLRAAYWTAMSLAVLQDKIPGFDRHLFALSGVSGGSLGGALFIALARDMTAVSAARCAAPPYEKRLDEAAGAYASCVRAFMRDDHLSPVLAKLVAPDFLQLFLPFPIPWFDRSIAIEQSWARSYASLKTTSTFTDGFAALPRQPTRDAAVPLLFLNSTHVQTGRRYITSVVVRREGTDSANHHLQDAGDVLGILKADLPLTAALHNSARFPYISPAGHLDLGDGVERGHLVDGGYFENSGLATLREIYEGIVEDETLTQKRLAIHVLYLCNDPANCGDRADPSDVVRSTAADELLSPVRTLLKTTDARGWLARAHLKEMIRARDRDRFLEMSVCRELKPAADDTQVDRTRARVISPSLGWLLSKQARDWMDLSLVGGTAANDQSSCYARNAAAIATLQRLLVR